MAGTLRDDLLAIPGIQDAELEGDAVAPAGVKVRLSTGADAEEVSRAVQRVLAAHGMRSQLNPPRVEPASPPPPPGAPGDVVALPGLPRAGLGAADYVEPELLRAEPSADTPGQPEPSGRSSAQPGSVSPVAAPIELESVAVEEGRMGVTVRVTTTDGGAVSREAAPIADGVDQAIVAALADLTDQRAVRLLGVQESLVEGTLVLTVVVELADRTRRAGAAVAEGGRAYGMARATWAALTS